MASKWDEVGELLKNIARQYVPGMIYNQQSRTWSMPYKGPMHGGAGRPSYRGVPGKGRLPTRHVDEFVEEKKGIGPSALSEHIESMGDLDYRSNKGIAERIFRYGHGTGIPGEREEDFVKRYLAERKISEVKYKSDKIKNLKARNIRDSLGLPNPVAAEVIAESKRVRASVADPQMADEMVFDVFHQYLIRDPQLLGLSDQHLIKDPQLPGLSDIGYMNEEGGAHIEDEATRLFGGLTGSQIKERRKFLSENPELAEQVEEVGKNLSAHIYRSIEPNSKLYANTLEQLNRLTTEIEALPPGDPRFKALNSKVMQAESELRQHSSVIRSLMSSHQELQGELTRMLADQTISDIDPFNALENMAPKLLSEANAHMFGDVDAYGERILTEEQQRIVSRLNRARARASNHSGRDERQKFLAYAYGDLPGFGIADEFGSAAMPIARGMYAGQTVHLSGEINVSEWRTEPGTGRSIRKGVTEYSTAKEADSYRKKASALRSQYHGQEIPTNVQQEIDTFENAAANIEKSSRYLYEPGFKILPSNIVPAEEIRNVTFGFNLEPSKFASDRISVFDRAVGSKALGEARRVEAMGERGATTEAFNIERALVQTNDLFEKRISGIIRSLVGDPTSDNPAYSMMAVPEEIQRIMEPLHEGRGWVTNPTASPARVAEELIGSVFAEGRRDDKVTRYKKKSRRGGYFTKAHHEFENPSADYQTALTKIVNDAKNGDPFSKHVLSILDDAIPGFAKDAQPSNMSQAWAYYRKFHQRIRREYYDLSPEAFEATFRGAQAQIRNESVALRDATQPLEDVFTQGEQGTLFVNGSVTTTHDVDEIMAYEAKELGSDFRIKAATSKILELQRQIKELLMIAKQGDGDTFHEIPAEIQENARRQAINLGSDMDKIYEDLGTDSLRDAVERSVDRYARAHAHAAEFGKERLTARQLDKKLKTLGRDKRRIQRKIEDLTPAVYQGPRRDINKETGENLRGMRDQAREAVNKELGLRISAAKYSRAKRDELPTAYRRAFEDMARIDEAYHTAYRGVRPDIRARRMTISNKVLDRFGKIMDEDDNFNLNPIEVPIHHVISQAMNTLHGWDDRTGDIFRRELTRSAPLLDKEGKPLLDELSTMSSIFFGNNSQEAYLKLMEHTGQITVNSPEFMASYIALHGTPLKGTVPEFTMRLIPHLTQQLPEEKGELGFNHIGLTFEVLDNMEENARKKIHMAWNLQRHIKTLQESGMPVWETGEDGKRQLRLDAKLAIEKMSENEIANAGPGGLKLTQQFGFQKMFTGEGATDEARAQVQESIKQFILDTGSSREEIAAVVHRHNAAMRNTREGMFISTTDYDSELRQHIPRTMAAMVDDLAESWTQNIASHTGDAGVYLAEANSGELAKIVKARHLGLDPWARYMRAAEENANTTTAERHKRNVATALRHTAGWMKNKGEYKVAEKFNTHLFDEGKMPHFTDTEAVEEWAQSRRYVEEALTKHNIDIDRLNSVHRAFRGRSFRFGQDEEEARPIREIMGMGPRDSYINPILGRGSKFSPDRNALNLYEMFGRVHLHNMFSDSELREQLHKRGTETTGMNRDDMLRGLGIHPEDAAEEIAKSLKGRYQALQRPEVRDYMDRNSKDRMGTHIWDAMSDYETREKKIPGLATDEKAGATKKAVDAVLDHPYSRISVDAIKKQWGNRAFRYSAIGAGALAAIGAIHAVRKKDHTPEDVSPAADVGPSNISRTNFSSQGGGYAPVEYPGVTYHVTGSGNFDPARFQQSVSSITGGNIHGTISPKRNFKPDNSDQIMRMYGG